MYTFGASVNAWSAYNPEMILYTFLPILLFSDTLFLKWYHVKGAFWQCLLLAFPGVVIGSFFLGGITKKLPLGWSWNLCMAFGYIITATDSVAVSATLANLGASPKLVMIMAGESLLNEGSAYVLFTLYKSLLEHESYTSYGLFDFIMRIVFVSPIVGCLFGLVSVWWMKQLKRQYNEHDVLIQVIITITCAYASFYTANYVMKISGVLSCCAAGLMFAWKAPPLILEPETMHRVWEVLEW